LSQLGLVMSADGGNEWSVAGEGLPENSGIYDIEFHPDSTNILYAAVGGDSGGLFKSYNYGINWSEIEITGNPLNRCLDIEIDPEDSGHLFAATGTFILFESTDFGANWDEYRYRYEDNMSTTIIDLYIDENNSDQMCAWATNMIYQYFIMYSTNGGNLFSNSPINGAGLHVDDFGYLYTSVRQGLSRSTDFGETWELIAPYFPTQAYNDDMNTVLHAGFSVNPENENSIFIDGNRGFYYTSDGGADAQIRGQEFSNGYPGIIDFCVNPTSDSDHYHILTNNGHWRSTDGGDSWQTINVRDPLCLAFTPQYPDTIYQGGFGILRSFNGGENQRYIELIAVEPEDPDIVYVEKDGLYRSEDSGLNWELLSSPGYARSMILLPNSDGLLFHTLRHLMYSSDGGETFTEISKPEDVVTIKDVALRNNNINSIWIGTSNGIYSSEDMGDTWDHIDGPYDRNVKVIEFSSDGTDLFVCTNDDGVWKANDLFTDVHDGRKIEFIPVSPIILTYPNPFNQSTTVKINISNDHFSNVSIFNVQGQLVRSLFDGNLSPGQHHLNWNGSDESNRFVTSGTYFLMLTTENEFLTKKITIIR
ncbi:MAG: T9SS type A sorting domain-containing protein, partial [Candidatus Electryonea clarkiae]|nr:T9SS type A sorting domain-containing protein [Candidatus Electryonea clarkiae]